MRTRCSLAILLAILLLFVAGSASAAPLDDNGGAGYFDIGSFRSYEAGGVIGEYAEQPEGLIISVYAADGSHILDIGYRDGGIDLYFQVLNDAVLKTLLEEEEWLQEYADKLSYLPLHFQGDSTCIYQGENCMVEIHNTSVRFFKIRTTGDIVFSSLGNYTVTPDPRRPASVNISRRNEAGETIFSGKIISSNELSCHNDTTTIIAHRTAMFRGVETGTLEDEEPIRTVAGALEAGTLGGEITVVKNGQGYKTDVISYYANVTVTAVEDKLSSRRIAFNVSGDSHATGKTVKINFGRDTLASTDMDELEVLFDGGDMQKASSLADVLNPNDDGLQPEYLPVQVHAAGGKEFFILVSIPHFSDHQVVVRTIADNPVLLALAATGAIAVVMAAAWGMFRRD